MQFPIAPPAQRGVSLQAPVDWLQTVARRPVFPYDGGHDG